MNLKSSLLLRKFGIVVLSVSMLGLAACSTTEKGAEPKDAASVPAPPAAAAPVTLTMYNWGSFTPEDIQQLVVEPLKKKYPHITMQFIDRGTGTLPEDLAAAGTPIDIILTNVDVIGRFNALGYMYDMKEDLKKANIDTGKIEQAGIERGTFEGKLVALPFDIVRDALYYNKAIFDRFGVAYPKDGLLWDDVVALAKQLTKMEGGVQYQGFDPIQILNFAGLTVVDAKTHKPLVGTEPWRSALELFKQFVSIPGNEKFSTSIANTGKAFIKDQSVAMTQGDLLGQLRQSANDLTVNWDLAQAASYKGKPNIAGWGQARVFAVTSSSKYKDDAFKVLSVLFSDEVQMQSSKNGKFSLSKNQAIKDSFGADLPFLKGKNTKAYFKSNPGSPRVESIYFSEVQKIFNDRTREYFEGGKDYNTLVREVEEQMQAKLATVAK
jgi:multiple sugar transport system substrate-binding protein